MESMRTKRAQSNNRAATRFLSIMLVLMVAGGALFLLMTMLDDYREQRAANPHTPGEVIKR